MRKKNPRLGVGNAFADSTDLRRLNPQSEVSLASTLAAMKRLFMDSEVRLVPPRPRWTRSCGSSTWKGISASPGPHQQGKLTAISGHTNTQSDQYVEVLGMQFSPDAAPSSANMTMDLRSSHNLLTCHLTKVVWWYKPSPGEGNLDCQSLSGRLGWSEEIANPSPLGSQNDSRAKWVGKTTLLQSRHTTACVEWSSAVRSQTSEIGVSCAPTDQSDLRRLNPPNELSPAMTLSGMRRLIDSDRSPASSLLVSHPCSYRRGRSVGAFSSVRRAGRLRIANGHARTHRRDVVSRPVWTAQQGLPLGSKQGTLMGSWYQPGTHGVPRQGRRDDPQACLVAWPAGSDRQVRRPSPVHLFDRSKLT
jgi:hypothetical protein